MPVNVGAFQLPTFTDTDPMTDIPPVWGNLVNALNAILAGRAQIPGLADLNAVAGQVNTLTNRVNQLSAAVDAYRAEVRDYESRTAASFTAPAALGFLPNWGNFGGGFSALRIWRVGSTAAVVGVVRPAVVIAAGTESAVAAAPAALRPPSGGGAIMGNAVANGNLICRVDVEATSGEIQVVPSAQLAAGSFVQIMASWPLG